jgi:hypothetical protein
MNDDKENLEIRPKQMGRDVYALRIYSSAGIFLANILIGPGDAINGHMDKVCRSNPEYEEELIDLVNNLGSKLPDLFPSSHLGGKVVKNIKVSDCSDHPDGGTNKRIDAKLV